MCFKAFNRARNPLGSFVYALDCLKELSTVSWKLELATRWLERPLLAVCKIRSAQPAKAALSLPGLLRIGHGLCGLWVVGYNHGCEGMEFTLIVIIFFIIVI